MSRFFRRSTVEDHPPAAESQVTEASLARKYSEDRLQTVQEAWPEVRSISEAFKKIRVENHFAERIREAHQS